MERQDHLNLFSLARSRAHQLRYVRRFTGCRLNHQENVAEHSFYVVFYCLLMGNALNAQAMHDCLEANQDPLPEEEPIDIGLLLTRAVVHDLEEAISGDFPRPFKYSDATLKEQLDIAGLKAMYSLLGGINMSTAERAVLLDAWSQQKDGSKESALLKFADLFAFLTFTLEEVRSGNKHILAYCTEVEPYLKLFKEGRYAFLPEAWLTQCWAIFYEIQDHGKA